VFQARISWQSKRLTAGYYLTAVEAARAHDRKLLEFAGPSGKRAKMQSRVSTWHSPVFCPWFAVPAHYLNFPVVVEEETSQDPWSNTPAPPMPAPAAVEQARKRPRPAAADTNGDADEPVAKLKDAKRARHSSTVPLRDINPATFDPFKHPANSRAEISAVALVALTEAVTFNLLSAQVALGTAATRAEAINFGKGASDSTSQSVAAIQEALSTAALKLASTFAINNQLQTYIKVGGVHLRSPGDPGFSGPLELLLQELPKSFTESLTDASKSQLSIMLAQRSVIEDRIRAAQLAVRQLVTIFADRGLT
jgi:hypothetical protein